MPAGVYTGLNPFYLIRKHFMQICVRKVAVHDRRYRPEPNLHSDFPDELHLYIAASYIAVENKKTIKSDR
jgi:hypothetical protein